MTDSLPTLRDALVIAGVALGVYVLLVAASQLLRRARAAT